MNVSSSIIVALPRVATMRIDVLRRMHAQQILVGGQARLDHLAALLRECRGDRRQHFGALGTLGMPDGRDVIDESLRADENQRHLHRLLICLVATNL